MSVNETKLRAVIEEIRDKHAIFITHLCDKALSDAGAEGKKPPVINRVLWEQEELKKEPPPPVTSGERQQTLSADELCADIDALQSWSRDRRMTEEVVERVKGSIRAALSKREREREKWQVAEGEAMLVVESQELRLHKQAAQLAALRKQLEEMAKELDQANRCVAIADVQQETYKAVIKQVEDLRSENEKLAKLLPTEEEREEIREVLNGRRNAYAFSGLLRRLYDASFAADAARLAGEEKNV